MNADLSFYTHTFKGRRDNNQDSCDAYKIKEGVYFLAVADGMGGTVGGQIASQLVLNEAKKILAEEFKNKVLISELKPIIERIFLLAQVAISKRVKLEPELNGMGTTLTCVLVNGDKYVWGNLGDSRIYLLSSNELKQITIDHTYVQDFLNDPNNSPSKNLVEKFGNYLMKSLDGGNDEADIYPKNKNFEILRNGEIFLLCSDGLINDKSNLDTTVFRECITSTPSIKEAAPKLISYAFQNGSKDNITCVLAEYGKLNRKIRKNHNFNATSIRQSKKIILRPVNIVLFFIVLLILMLSYFMFIKKNISNSKTSKDSVTTIVNQQTAVSEFKQKIESLLKENDLASVDKAFEECQKFRDSKEIKELISSFLIEIKMWYTVHGEYAIRKKNYTEAEKIFASALQNYKDDSLFKSKLIFVNNQIH
jgi:protein phosphatase